MFSIPSHGHLPGGEVVDFRGSTESPGSNLTCSHTKVCHGQNWTLSSGTLGPTFKIDLSPSTRSELCLLLSWVANVPDPLFFLVKGSLFYSLSRMTRVQGKSQDSPHKSNLIQQYERQAEGTSLLVQWLRLHVPSAGGTGLIPGRGAKNPHAVRCSPKEKDGLRILGFCPLLSMKPWLNVLDMWAPNCSGRDQWGLGLAGQCRDAPNSQPRRHWEGSTLREISYTNSPLSTPAPTIPWRPGSKTPVVWHLGESLGQDPWGRGRGGEGKLCSLVACLENFI